MVDLWRKINNRAALLKGRIDHEWSDRRYGYREIRAGLRQELAAELKGPRCWRRLFDHWLEASPRSMRVYEDRYTRPQDPERPLADGWVRIFDRLVPLAPPVDWHRDPILNARWPKRYVPTIRDDREGTDLVLLWHLNKMMFLLDAAYAYRLSREPRYAARCVEWITSWVEQNPFMVGMNWRSPMEVGTRLVSWTFALQETGFAAPPSDDQLSRIIGSVLQQARFLTAHFSHTEVPNNHLIGDAATLYFVAAMWPIFEESPRWKEQSDEVLRTELDRQILPDGLQFENAFNYHLYVLDYYLLYLYAKRLRDETPDRDVVEGVRRIAETLLVSRSGTGRVPRFGDDSMTDFFILRSLEEIESRHYASHPTLVEIVKPECGEVLAACEWGGDLLRLEVAETLDRHLAESGFTIVRRRDSHLVYGAGPVHDREFADGHVHSDAGSFELEAAGVPLFIDPGTYLYGSIPERDHLRGATAHNRLLVDDRDPMRPLHRFAWHHVPRGESTWFSSGETLTAAASCQVLPSAHADFRHERVVVQVRDRVWVVGDFVRVVPGKETGRSVAAMRFHSPLPAAAFTEIGETGVRIDISHAKDRSKVHGNGAPQGWVLSAASEGEHWRHVISDPADRATWYSRWYGDLRYGTTIETRRVLDTDAVIVHTLAPEGTRTAVDFDGPGTSTLTIDWGDRTDTLVVRAEPVNLMFNGESIVNLLRGGS